MVKRPITHSNQSSGTDIQERFWHVVWAVAGLAATVYGCVGVYAQFTQPNRHPFAVVWFIIAAVGGASMISFVWRSGEEDE